MSHRPAARKLPGRNDITRRTGAATTAFGDLAHSGRLRTVSLDMIAPNRHQPRTRFDEDSLVALASSIRERGILQPPVVRELSEGAYELVAGERRCRAARLAGRETIDVLVSDHDDAAALQDALVENIARDDLSPVEAARAYATIIEDLGITREELGRRVGQSRVSISNHLRLLDLPDDALSFIDDGRLTFAHGRALLLCDDHATRLRLARDAVAQGWSTRQLEQAARSAGAPRIKRPLPSADAQAFAQRLTDALNTATGLDLHARVTTTGAVTITITDHAAARTLAARLGAPANALDEPAGSQERSDAPAR